MFHDDESVLSVELDMEGQHIRIINMINRFFYL